ncbi:DNA primase, partial [Candidatus Pacearchaeota archaeon]|nr:DNA primase [Candidatus Pacearchaeota archaeon]
MMNPGDFKSVVESVRERIDIEDVIGKYLQLNGKLKAICPFHEDKSPSFSVNPDGQYFHCFGCGVGGDVFKFLMLYEEKDFMTVLCELADKAGVTLPQSTSADRHRIEEERTVEDILTASAQFYHD